MRMLAPLVSASLIPSIWLLNIVRVGAGVFSNMGQMLLCFSMPLASPSVAFGAVTEHELHHLSCQSALPPGVEPACSFWS